MSPHKTWPKLSILIPSAGRPELHTCLSSISFQLHPGDEVLVIGDDLDDPLINTQDIVQHFGPQFRYIAHAGSSHTFGHEQLNYAITQARGDWLCFQDDDDVYVPTALEAIRQAIRSDPDHLQLFRFLTYHTFLCWLQLGLFAEGYIGGHCLVCPNVPAKLAQWGLAYTGDWDFVRDTVEINGGIENVIWRDEVIAIARPEQRIIDEILRLANSKEIMHV